MFTYPICHWAPGTWQIVVDETANNEGEIGLANYTWVTVCESALVPVNGSKVRATARAASGGTYATTEVWVGRKAASGDAWDFESSPAPVEMKWGGTSGFSISADGESTSDETTFSSSSSAGLSIASFHTSAGWYPDGVTTVTNCETYKKVVDEPEVADKGASYAAGLDLAGIIKIEVFG